MSALFLKIFLRIASHYVGFQITSVVIVHSLLDVDRNQRLCLENLRTRTLEVMVDHLNLVYLSFYEEVGKFKTYLYAFMGIRLVGKSSKVATALYSELVHLLCNLTAYRIDNDLYSLLFITVYCTLHHFDDIGIETSAKA